MTLVIVFDFANSEDTGEMLCYAAFHLGLLWLHNSYTAQQKFSTNFNTMSHFEWTWIILFNVINMYGDLEIYIFPCPPDKKLSG